MDGGEGCEGSLHPERYTQIASWSEGSPRKYPQTASWSKGEESSVPHLLSKRTNTNPNWFSGRAPFIPWSVWAAVISVSQHRPEAVSRPQTLRLQIALGHQPDLYRCLCKPQPLCKLSASTQGGCHCHTMSSWGHCRSDGPAVLQCQC